MLITRKRIIFGEGATQGLDNTTLTAEKEYSINLTEHNKIFCLNHGVEIIKFKAKNPEIVATPSYLGNIWKEFSIGNMKKTGLNEYVYDFSVDYNTIAVDDTLDIHKYLMKKYGIK